MEPRVSVDVADLRALDQARRRYEDAPNERNAQRLALAAGCLIEYIPAPSPVKE